MNSVISLSEMSLLMEKTLAPLITNETKGFSHLWSLTLFPSLNCILYALPFLLYVLKTKAFFLNEKSVFRQRRTTGPVALLFPGEDACVLFSILIRYQKMSADCFVAGEAGGCLLKDPGLIRVLVTALVTDPSLWWPRRSWTPSSFSRPQCPG